MYNQISNRILTYIYKKSRANIFSISNYFTKDENILIDAKKFKEKYPNYKAIKIIGNNMKNFKYKEGINENNEKFIPSIKCEGKGLYFTDKSKICTFIDDCYGNMVAHIELLDGEKIWIEKNKCKTHKFKITKIESISNYLNNLSINEQLNAVKQNGFLIKYITNQFEHLQIEAVNKHYSAIKYIKNPSKETQLYAVKQDGYLIEYIKNPSEKIQLEAIKQNAHSIKYIENPSQRVINTAIKIYMHK
jgi:hypothetical protein